VGTPRGVGTDVSEAIAKAMCRLAHIVDLATLEPNGLGKTNGNLIYRAGGRDELPPVKGEIMPITKQDDWNKWVENNQDDYGKACVDVAKTTMELLDECDEFDPDDIIIKADRTLGLGITGFMAGCVAQMISQCHSRGEEFRKKWNLKYQIKDEGEKANKSGTVLNPAIINIG
jgi:hypothetical protein